jgi:cyclophilin family peptidyl-prolyl cis-trans isomerase
VPIYSRMNPLPDDARHANRSGPIIRMTTERGFFWVQLFPDAAPKHCERIVRLVEEGFYDGIRFHRIEPKFVAQVGDPKSREGVDQPGVGSGGSSYSDLPLEVNRAYKNERGSLAMARTDDPNSANSQFYFVLENAPFLDMKYTVFGRVLDDGMTVVDQVRRGDSLQAVVIKK